MSYNRCKLMDFIFVLAIIMLVFMVGCGGRKTIGLPELRSYKADVQKCMGTEDMTDTIPMIPIDGDTVLCNGQKKGGCYQNGTVTLPKKADENTIKHEYVHYYCDKRFGFGNDPSHGCVDSQGQSYYLKCGGVIVE